MADVKAALEAFAADPTAPLDAVKKAYQSDWESFDTAWRDFAETAETDVVDALRPIIATFNPEPPPPADAEA